MMRGLLFGAMFIVAGATGAGAQELSDLFTGGAPTNGIVPMETILSAARGQIEGVVTEIELERKRGAWVYEVEMTASDGRKWELLYDAHTGGLLKRKRD